MLYSFILSSTIQYNSKYKTNHKIKLNVIKKKETPKLSHTRLNHLKSIRSIFKIPLNGLYTYIFLSFSFTFSFFVAYQTFVDWTVASFCRQLRLVSLMLFFIILMLLYKKQQKNILFLFSCSCCCCCLKCKE